MIALLAIGLLLVYLTVNFASVLVRNYKAHKFFATKALGLPVVPRPNIVFGHFYWIIRPWKNWKVIEDLHEKYGTTFGYYMIDQPWVSTKDLDLIKLMCVDEAQKHINRGELGFPFDLFHKAIGQMEDDRWRKARRLFAQAFTNHKVRSDEVSSDIESIVGQVEASLERRLEKSRHTTGNNDDSQPASFVLQARDLFERYTLGVILLTTYKQSDLIDYDSDEDTWVRLIEAAAREASNPITYTSIAFPFLRPLCRVLANSSLLSYTGSMSTKLTKFVLDATELNRVARERQHRAKSHNETKSGVDAAAATESSSRVKSDGIFKRRMVDTIIDGFLDGKIDYDGFSATLVFVLLAGFMSTADTLTCLAWQLAWNQEIQDKLRKTILEEGIDADYVVWCINETVRYHPAVPLGGGRTLGEDVTINGLFLPKGTGVLPTTHGIHHDPNIWPDPERFDPERWRNQASFHPAAFVGFGLGPRNCLGGKLAVHEIKLLMRMILTKYKIETCDETPKEWNFSSPMMLYTLNDEPIKVKFTELTKTEATTA